MRGLLHSGLAPEADAGWNIFICSMVWGTDGVPNRTLNNKDWVDAREMDIGEMGRFCKLVNEYAKQARYQDSGSALLYYTGSIELRAFVHSTLLECTRHT